VVVWAPHFARHSFVAHTPAPFRRPRFEAGPTRAFRLRRAELSEPDCHLTGDFGYWIGQMIKGEALAHLLGLQLGDIVQN